MLGINALIDIAARHRGRSNQQLIVLVLNNRDLNQVTWEQRVLVGDPKLEASQVIPDFPYAEYATRQLRLQYSLGVERAKYREITLFDKLEETLGQHELEAVFEQEQPWGSVEVGAEFSQYLHDLGKYRLEVDGELSFRITRGLSINLDGSASRIRDSAVS